jgi:hypothetical protein
MAECMNLAVSRSEFEVDDNEAGGNVFCVDIFVRVKWAKTK